MYAKLAKVDGTYGAVRARFTENDMTSIERYEMRYQRRRAKRLAKRDAVGGKPFEEVFNFGTMCEAGRLCCNGARWKTTTIHFETNLLPRVLNSLKILELGRRDFHGYKSFTLIDHGKARNIDAVDIDERMIQKCFCRNMLTELFSRSFIYDNAASLAGKGMDFALRRLKEQLRRHYRRHGLQGGILQFDFKNYFGSLPHEQIKSRACAKIKDPRLQNLFCCLVDDFQRMKTAARGEHRGVGLGSEVSQIIALDYVSPIDHYIKEKWRVKGYGRYMDDGWVISDDLEQLRFILADIQRMAQEIGIQLSEKKCVITPFKHHSFRFLKMRFSLKPSGKVVMKLNRASIKAIRRKMIVFRKWVTSGKISAEDAFQSYQSWRAHAKRCNSYETLHSLDKRFVGLFRPELAKRRCVYPCTISGWLTEGGWVYGKVYRTQAI